MIRFLLDEHIPKAVRRELVRRIPDPIVECIGDPGMPSKETSDPALLAWCEDHEAVLVSKDRRTLPHHVGEHFQTGGHIPGLLLAPSEWDIGDFVEELTVIALASTNDEYRDTIRYLPVT